MCVSVAVCTYLSWAKLPKYKTSTERLSLQVNYMIVCGHKPVKLITVNPAFVSNILLLSAGCK